MSPPRRRGKPSRFTEAVREEIVDYIERGATIKAVAQRVSIGERTLHEWRARGQAGEAPYAEWEARIADALARVHAIRRYIRRSREEAEAKERWGRFKAAQARYRLAQLGPEEFWRNRLAWLLAHGHRRAFARTLAILRAKNIRIFGRQ